MPSEKTTGGIFFDSDGNPNPVHFVIFSFINSTVIGYLLDSPPAGGIIFFAVMILYGFGFFSQKKDEEA